MQSNTTRDAKNNILSQRVCLIGPLFHGKKKAPITIFSIFGGVRFHGSRWDQFLRYNLFWSNFLVFYEVQKQSGPQGSILHGKSFCVRWLQANETHPNIWVSCVGANEARNAKTPPPVHGSAKAMKRWL